MKRAIKYEEITRKTGKKIIECIKDLDRKARGKKENEWGKRSVGEIGNS